MKPKRVLVTGGTRGLGLAICRELKDAGYYVIAAARKPSPELDALIALPPAENGGSVVFETLDLAKTDKLHAFARDTAKKHEGLYGLVNNAAIAHDGVLATMHESEIAETIQVNVVGTIILTKYAIRPMLVGGEGRVINVSSIISNTGFNGLSVYAASKAALNGFTRSLARELGKAGITVNALLPGYMETNMSAGLDADKLAAIARRSPLGRLARVEDVACSVKFFLSSEAAMITGTTLTVDAGSTS